MHVRQTRSGAVQEVQSLFTERGLDWEGAREMMENMLGERFLCECEMVWRLRDEQLK